MFDSNRVILVGKPNIGARLLGFDDACVSSRATCTFVPADPTARTSV